MDTFWLLLYCAPLLLVMLTGCPWPFVLLIGLINILGGWTIIGWFVALWMAGDMIRARAGQPLGIVKLFATVSAYLWPPKPPR